MDTTRISELASQVRELDRKVDRMPRDLQFEIYELDSKIGRLKMEALTKTQAISAAFVVWCLIILIAAARRQVPAVEATTPPPATPTPGSSATRCNPSPAPRPLQSDSARP